MSSAIAAQDITAAPNPSAVQPARAIPPMIAAPDRVAHSYRRRGADSQGIMYVMLTVCNAI